MKLDPDCVRSILTAVESMDYGETTTPDKLHSELPQYSVDQIEYTCLILGDGDYLDISTVSLSGFPAPQVASVNSLTYKGHEFLGNIRKDNIWEGIKKIAEKVGVTSLDSFVQISAKVVVELIKKQFSS